MEEDTQPITEPIVPPIVSKEFDIIEKKIPNTNFEFDFLAGLMTKPELIRNV
jgi:U5 small nuclear ribonucleoprotein component